MAKSSSPISILKFSVTRWIADNVYFCEGCTVPRWLLYELYTESCIPDCNNQVNQSGFGKFLRLVFPGLKTRRMGKRGNVRYHYVGIAIKNNSSCYARYCSLLNQNNHHRDNPTRKVTSSTRQLSTYVVTSGNACCSGDACGYKSNSQQRRTSKTLHCSPTVFCLKTEQEVPWPGLSGSSVWEQNVWKEYRYEMIALLANEYYSHCEDIINTVRNGQLHKVEVCIMSFWRSLQPEAIALLSLPYVCQLFKCYDRHLFKKIENILFHDFLDDVPMEDMKSIRLFSEIFQVWLLNALEGFPLLLKKYKSEEVTLFIKRLRRKIDLSSIAKTMKTILNNHSGVTLLRLNLQDIINQRFLEVPGNLFQTKCKNPEELQNNIGLKCLIDILPLLTPYTDIRVLLNCMSSNLQAFVIQPSRSKKGFRKLASDFQLRWNFLLNAVSKAMTLSCGPSFGHWHLLNFLLMDYVAHVFLSYAEKEEDENFWLAMQNKLPVLWHYKPNHLCHYFVQETHAPQTDLTTVMQSHNYFGLSENFPEF